MIEFGLVLARLLHYAATTTLFGVSLFALYAYAGSEPDDMQRWRIRLLLWSAIVAILSGLLWFTLSTANMSGSLSDLTDPEVVWAVAHDTSFGLVWTGRMVLAGIVIVLITVRPVISTTTIRDIVLSISAAMLLASLAAVGHTQAEEGWGGFVHMLSDAAHLLAAGAWLGGLILLAHILDHERKTPRGVGPIEKVLMRFSGMGYLAVATLIGTGLINSWFLVGSVSNLARTTYGQVLLAKLLLFAGMLALAVANRFWFVPSLNNSRSHVSDDKPAAPLRNLYNHVLGEELLGATVLFIVSVLGMLQPAIGQ